MKTKEKQKNRTSLNEMFYNKKTQRLEKIDNRLVRKERRLENVNNKTKIQFNDLTQEDDLLVLQEDECKLSMKLLGKKEKEQTKFAARQVKQLQDKKVLYEDVFEDSDVEYEILEDKKIKENIVIKNNNKETYEYQYLLTLENLTLKKEQNTKTLQFVNEKGKALFTMVEPVMFDSNNSSSNDITYEVKHLEENKYLLTLKADESWINSKERVLPIYLDPTLLITSPQLFTWYIIKPYNECVSYESQYSGPVLNYRHYAVMSLDTELLKELIDESDISLFKVWIWTSEARENVYLQCTDALPSELKPDYLNDCSPVRLDMYYNTPLYSNGAYLNLFDIKDMVNAGKRTFIFRCDVDNSTSYDELSVRTAMTSYQLEVNYEFVPQLDVEIEKKYSFSNTKINEKIVISKCLLTNEFRMNILDLEKLNRINLSHIYSTSDFIPNTIKDALFSQYGENFRINYSYLLYDATQTIVDVNGAASKEGDFVLIDSNDNIVKYKYANGEIVCENDPKQKLTVNGEKIIISSPISKMTFVKTTLTDFYLLSSIEDLIYGQYIDISYNNDKVTISSIVDEKNNRLDFHYDENGKLSSIDKNNGEYMILVYNESKLTSINYHDYDNRRIVLQYINGNKIIINDSYENTYYRITNKNNQLIVYDLNLNKSIKQVDICDCYVSISNRYGEKQILVFEDDKVCSSYTLKSTSTDDNVVLYSNVNYSSFSESEVEEGNGTTTRTTISESGSLNINNNNLTTDNQFNAERYECDLFNGKNVFYLSNSSSSTNVIECTLTDAQLSRLTKGTYYTFGVFLKALTEDISSTTVIIKLLNGSTELASKTFDKIKPVWDFKFLSFKYYEQDDNIASLKIRIEISNNNADIIFANPILRNDASYTYIKSVSSFDEDQEEYRTIKITISNGFKKTETFDDKFLLINSVTEDLHKNNYLLSNESITYDSSTYQPLTKTYSSNTKLLNKNAIENIYSSKKLEKTNIYSSKGENLVIQNKYNFDSFGNSNPTYDERDALIETCVYNNDGTIDSTSTPDLAAILCDYDSGVLTKLSTSSNSYYVDFDYDDDLITEIKLNNKTTYSYDYDYENMVNTVKVNGTLYSYNKLEREINIISVIEKIGSHFERKYVYNLEEKLTAIYENDNLKTSCFNNDYGQTAMFKEIIDDDTNIIKRYYYFNDDREKVKIISYSGFYTLSVTNQKFNYIDCSQSSSVVLGGETYSYKYTYNNNLEKILTKIEYPNTIHTIDYNGFGNIEKQTTTKGSLNITNSYVYQNVTSVDDKIRTSNYVESVAQVTKYNGEEKSNSYIIHSYNPNGTISYMNIGGENYSFTYDLFGRLKKEISSYSGITKEYTYDNNGNVTYITETDALNQVKVTQQSFNNANKLQSINHQDGSFVEITYDEIGNPILISKNGLCESGTGFETENIALTYEKGNRLSTYGNNISFKYDLSGMRISKLVGNELHKYYIHDGNILREEVTNSVTGSLIYTLDFYYDETGVCSFKHNNAMYYYQKDLTGSIIGVYNDFGNIVAKYRYDAWGNHKVYDQLNQEISLNTFIGNINPFRFKSYYFDRETNLYYCKSRYYNPQWRRWLTCDSVDYLEPSSFSGLNLYCYCNNDSINNYDPSGCFMISTAVLIGAIIGAVVVGAIGGVIAYNVAEEKGAEGWELFGWTLLGVFAGSIVGAIIGGAIGYGIGYAAGGTYANGLVAKSVTKGVNSFFSQSNKVRKLLKITRHNLSKYTPKTAAKLMKKTLAKGTFEAYKTVNSMVLASTNSQVTYVIINGAIMISDMWIRMGG